MESTNFIIGNTASDSVKNNTKTDQKPTNKRKGEKYQTDASFLKKNVIKGVKKNPTIELLRAAVRETTDTPAGLWDRYNPCYKRDNEIKPKNVFKISTAFLTPSKNYQIEMIATDNPSTIQGDYGKMIQKFKQTHEWTYNESIVVFFFRLLNTTKEKNVTVFVMDIPSFLHSFKSTSFLKAHMHKTAILLSKSWNAVNSSSDKAAIRSSNELPLILDYRDMGWSKPSPVELALVGTTYNHTLETQDDTDIVNCEPKKIVFQLRYQISNSRAKKGMLCLTSDEWIDFIEQYEFRQFYTKLWDFLPLTSAYSDRLQGYFELTTHSAISPKPLYINTGEKETNVSNTRTSEENTLYGESEE